MSRSTIRGCSRCVEQHLRRPPNPAIASQSAMVQVDRLVPPKRQAIRQHFATPVAERFRPQPRMVSVQRFARRAAVAWGLQVSLAITLLSVTQVGVPLDPHPVAELERLFGIAQGVRRDRPATTEDERQNALHLSIRFQMPAKFRITNDLTSRKCSQ